MHRLAIGEQARQLLARHPRPGADIAGIKMHEGGAGGRIEANAADLLAHTDFPQLLQRHAGEIEVHRLAERMLAELRHAAAAAAQHGVGGG